MKSRVNLEGFVLASISGSLCLFSVVLDPDAPWFMGAGGRGGLKICFGGGGGGGGVIPARGMDSGNGVVYFSGMFLRVVIVARLGCILTLWADLRWVVIRVFNVFASSLDILAYLTQSWHGFALLA